MLSLYNTLTRKKETFTPLDPPNVTLYLCGPTVYDRAHIGNARSVVVFDVLRRLLETTYAVTYVRNITDIDDKIMNAAKEKNISIHDLTHQTTAYYHEDMAALKTRVPTHEPRATDHIPSIIDYIQKLITASYAYEVEGHVLFDVLAYGPYGSLSRCHPDDIVAGARVDVAPYKKNPQDFVLWKPSSVDQPGWDSPWGRGRPGWHIECSAMSHDLLGPSFDIHGGGQDLMFPHHENEMAQSQSLYGSSSFARYWLHIGLLTVNGQKMSKSLGNFLTVKDLRQKAPGEVLRLALLSTHYRQNLDWTDDSIVRAKATLDRFYRALEGFKGEGQPSDLVLKALNDDLNIPQALTYLHDIVHKIYQEKDEKTKTLLQGQLKASALLMGLLEESVSAWFQTPDASLSRSHIEDLLTKRHMARSQGDFKEADRIRAYLLTMNIIIEDTPLGSTWRMK